MGEVAMIVIGALPVLVLAAAVALIPLLGDAPAQPPKRKKPG
jgi:hypothetical protein